MVWILKAEEAEAEKEESAKKFKNNYSKDNQELGAIWFDKIEEAEAFLEKITGNAGMKIVTEDGTIYEMMNGHVETVVETFKTEEVKTYAPKLYKLSTIQTEADRRFGMSASRTQNDSSSMNMNMFLIRERDVSIYHPGKTSQEFLRLWAR